MQIDQAVADILYCRLTQAAGLQLFLVTQQTICPLLNLRLGIKLRFEPVDITVVRIQRIRLRPFEVKAQHIAQEIAADIRLGHTIPIEAYALCAQVIVAVRQCRNEMSAEPPYIRLAHLPDTEETQDMIYAVGIEIILHLAETLLPPAEVILRHLIPVICREAPVLTTDREVIGWSTGTGVQIKQLRINRSIHAVRADSDRYITLHRYADRVCVSHCVCQLLIGMELQEFIEVLRLFVALCQECSIRLQPLLVLCLKRLVFLAAEERILILLIQRLEEHHLSVIYVLIVRKIQGVESRLLRVVFLLLCRSQTTHLFDIDVYRVQCKHAHRIIRIAVEVIMTQRRIVDRQGLNHLLPRSRSPVCHFLQVLELTNTEAFFATQREYRYGYTGTFPTRLRTTESTVVLIDHASFLYTPYLTVLAPFGVHHRSGLQVVDHVFVFHDILPLYHDICAPKRELRIVHHELVIRIPVTQLIAVTDDSYALRRFNLRQVN